MAMLFSLLRAPHKERPVAVLAIFGGETVNLVPKLVVMQMLGIAALQSVAQVFQVRSFGLGLMVLDQLVQFRGDGNAFGHHGDVSHASSRSSRPACLLPQKAEKELCK